MSRDKQVKLLKSYLTNPGRFSILVLGDRGVGKSHWVKEIAKSFEKDGELGIKVKEVIGTYLNILKPDEIEKVFTDSNGKTLIIKDVELINKETQDILFQTLSTSNGKFGLREKNIECRIVFTSTFKIESLRDTERYLSHRFFDRIAQLIVKLPSYQDGNRSIFQDFKDTWKKMDFPDETFPVQIKEWLEAAGHKFYGNFRDLDKIAINWRNHQIFGLEEGKIEKKVKEDFEKYYHFPENQLENKDYFPIDDDADYYKEILPNFRSHIKRRALEIYNGDLKKALDKKPFGVSYRTMEKW